MYLRVFKHVGFYNRGTMKLSCKTYLKLIDNKEHWYSSRNIIGIKMGRNNYYVCDGVRKGEGMLEIVSKTRNRAYLMRTLNRKWINRKRMIGLGFYKCVQEQLVSM